MAPGVLPTCRFVIWTCLLLTAATGLAVGQAPPVGTASSGMRGLVHTGLPISTRELNLNGNAGYGFTEPIDPGESPHHRGQASFGASIAPWPFLAFALRFDGRLEVHPDDDGVTHSAGFGDPRLFVRAGHALSPSVSVGGELGVWFPGTEAPSLVPDATSPEARVLFAYTPQGSPWALLAASGFRLDNSGNAAPDLTRLRLGDRVSLGMSDSNAVLIALGAARRFGSAVEVFAEASADLLVGPDAPELAQSPLRAALGGRYFLSRALQAEFTATVSLSQRPPVGPTDPLVPIEPRVQGVLGLRYSFDLEPGATEVAPPPDSKPKAAVAVVPALPKSPQVATVAGVLTDDGGEPLPDARIRLRGADGVEHELISDAEGRYSFADVPVGPASLEVSATGFQTQAWEIDVQPGLAPEAARALVPKTDVGVLRGLVRSFTSEPLRAQIVVQDKRKKVVASLDSAEDGRFELELAPGNYRVTIKSSGFRVHERQIKVEGNGVSILNVDMREQK
jgi:Carboxypeptidase regulatory-like domain